MAPLDHKKARNLTLWALHNVWKVKVWKTCKKKVSVPTVKIIFSFETPRTKLQYSAGDHLV